MRYLKKIIVFIFIRFIGLLAFFIPDRIFGIFTENFRVIRTNKLGVKYWLDSELSFIRFNRAYKSEPFAYEFVASMHDGSCFWDIGACIGTFSALAASQGRAKVIAFEANPFNLKALFENMSLNKPKEGSLVVSICLADRDHMIGLTGNVISGNAIPIVNNEIGDFKYFLPALSLSFNGLSDLDQPSHIKIDVDGNELSVLESLKSVLLNPKLRYIYIEISVNQNIIKNLIEEYKFTLIKVDGENYLYHR